MTDHPGREELKAFLEVKAPPAIARRVVEHLGRRCEVCRRLLAELARPATEADYDRALARSAERAEVSRRLLAVERLLAAGQWASLEMLERDEQLARVRADASLANLGLVHLLCDRARVYGWDDPLEAVACAQLAVEAALRLDPARYGGASYAAEVLLEAQRTLAHALRVSGELAQAARVAEEARATLGRTGGDRADRARLVALEAAIARDQGERQTAAELFSVAARLAGSGREPALAARYRIREAVLRGLDSPAAGLALLGRAAVLLEGEGEPRLRLELGHARASSPKSSWQLSRR